MQLAEKFKITPFLKILPLFCIGITAAGFVTAPLWMVFVAAVTVYVIAWVLRGSAEAGWYVAAAVVMTGMLLTLLTLTKDRVPRGEKVYITAEVTETPYTSGRWQRTSARVGYFRETGVTGETGGTKWHSTNEKIQVYFDTCYNISLGDQFTASAYLNPIDTAGSRYGALMRSRGMNSRAYITPGSVAAQMKAQKKSVRYYSCVMQNWISAIIDRLDMDTENRDMVKTLVAGDRTTLDRNLRTAYSNVGASHILSVSGLHMGFVFILVNLIFSWTAVVFRRGHLVKNILAVVAIWLYAMCAGLTPPVVRAAMMLSAAQIALFGSVQGNGYNIILACATFMLAVNPFYLYDVSFQLSFIAVLSIMFFYPRMYRKVFSSNRILDSLWSTVLLGVAAQIGTIPIVAYNFSNIPLVSALINPVIVLTAFLIIMCGLVWVIVPFGFLNPAVSAVLDLLVNVQNKTVLWADSLPAASIKNVEMPAWGVLLFYIILGLAALFIKINEERKETLPKLNGI